MNAEVPRWTTGGGSWKGVTNGSVSGQEGMLALEEDGPHRRGLCLWVRKHRSEGTAELQAHLQPISQGHGTVSEGLREAGARA